MVEKLCSILLIKLGDIIVASTIVHYFSALTDPICTIIVQFD